MRYRILNLIVLFIMAGALSLMVGCSDGKNENPYLHNITLSTSVEDMQPVGVANKFKADVSKIYCTFDITDNVGDSDITIVWIYVYEDNGNRTEFLIENWTENASGHDKMSMYIYQPIQGWPLGEWRAELFVDDVRAALVPFTIEL